MCTCIHSERMEPQARVRDLETKKYQHHAPSSQYSGRGSECMTELGASKGRRQSFTGTNQKVSFLKRRFQRKIRNVNHGLDVLSYVVLTLWSGDSSPSVDSKTNSRRFANTLKVNEQQVNQSPASSCWTELKLHNRRTPLHCYPPCPSPL